MYLFHGVALQQCVTMLIMLPIEVITLSDLLFDFCLYFQDVVFAECLCGGLVLFSENAYIIGAFKPT
jgi:hypothetical protein